MSFDAEAKAAFESVHRMLHQAWTAAVPPADYDKAKWNALETSIYTLHATLMEQVSTLTAELGKAHAELFGVMHSVDKWLSEKQLSENPATRAADAREVALRAIEAEARERDEAREQLAEAQMEREVASKIDREFLGQVVRAEWIAWAKGQPNPKPSWLQPWEELTEPEREV